MYQRLFTYAFVGLLARRVRVEVTIRRGTPMLLIVGLSPSSARQTVERIRAAAARVGLRIPGLRITVNLAPADLPKSGSAFDLPIALSVFAAAGHVPTASLKGLAATGELGLDGSIRGVRGCLPMCLAAQSEPDITRLIVPDANLVEAAHAEGLEVFGVNDLAGAVAWLNGRASLSRPAVGKLRPPRPGGPDLADVRGQPVARRILEIAAAGGHHLLLIGEPGIGKTMLARRLVGLLPPLRRRESIEASSIHSLAGLLDPSTGLLHQRPLRAPHHSTTLAGLVGGGTRVRPGEISLAHHGVLFLDELGEFSPAVLNALRQPLSDGAIRIVRASGTYDLPARFQLVATMNGCPCGYVTSSEHTCRCSEWQVRRYVGRVSGPLLDRIDLVHEMDGARQTPIGAAREESTLAVAQRVKAARRFASERGQEGTNAALDPVLLRRHCRIDEEAARLLAVTARRDAMSMRRCHRVLRVARSIADLATRVEPSLEDVAEALAYRRRVGVLAAAARPFDPPSR